MEAKHVSRNKFFLILIFLLFVASNLFAQTEKEIYFLIDKNDTLIKKQIATKENHLEGYLIMAEARKKPLNRTPLVEGKVWVPNMDTVPFDLSGNSYFFIEPVESNDTYLLREVFPLVF